MSTPLKQVSVVATHKIPKSFVSADSEPWSEFVTFLAMVVHGFYTALAGYCVSLYCGLVLDFCALTFYEAADLFYGFVACTFSSASFYALYLAVQTWRKLWISLETPLKPAEKDPIWISVSKWVFFLVTALQVPIGYVCFDETHTPLVLLFGLVTIPIVIVTLRYPLHFYPRILLCQY